MYEPDLEEPCVGNDEWIHEDDLPDYDYAKEMLHGVRNAIYETGDIENLEDCLECLMDVFKLKIPKTEPLLEKKGSRIRKTYFNEAI